MLMLKAFQKEHSNPAPINSAIFIIGKVLCKDPKVLLWNLNLIIVLKTILERTHVSMLWILFASFSKLVRSLSQ